MFGGIVGGVSSLTPIHDEVTALANKHSFDAQSYLKRGFLVWHPIGYTSGCCWNKLLDQGFG